MLRLSSAIMRFARSNVGFGIAAIAFGIAVLLLGNFFGSPFAQLGGTACNDGLDNNANGKIDTADTLYCSGSSDTTEGDPNVGQVKSWTIDGKSRIVQQCAPAAPCNRPEWAGAGGTNTTTLIIGVKAGDVIRARISGSIGIGGGVQIPCGAPLVPGGPSVVLQFLAADGSVVAYSGGAAGAVSPEALQNEITVPSGAVTLVGGVGDTVNSDNTGSCMLNELLLFSAHDTAGADCTILSAPDSVQAGAAFTAQFTLKNTGPASWVPGVGNGPGYKLMSMTTFDNSRWGAARVQLPGNVAPGQTVNVTANLTAPTVTGTFPFDWEMGEEDVRRFGQSCRKMITVVPATNACAVAYEYSISTAPTVNPGGGASVLESPTCDQRMPAGGGWELVDKICTNVTGAGCISDLCLWKKPATGKGSQDIAYVSAAGQEAQCPARTVPLKAEGCAARLPAVSGSTACTAKFCLYEGTGLPNDLRLTQSPQSGNGTVTDLCQNQPPAGYATPTTALCAGQDASGTCNQICLWGKLCGGNPPPPTIFCLSGYQCTKQGVASNCLAITPPTCPAGKVLQTATIPASCGTTGCSGQCMACVDAGSSSSAPSFCAICGDNVVVSPEECDHGTENGQDGECTADCKLLKPAANSSSSTSGNGRSSSSTPGFCPVDSSGTGDGTATRVTVTGDKDGFGIGLAPSTTYQNIRAMQPGCDEPPAHDRVSYGTGWGNRPLPAGYNGAVAAAPFTVSMPRIIPAATIDAAVLTLHVADMDDGQPGVDDTLFLDGQEIQNAFQGAGAVQYLPDPQGKTGIMSVTLTGESLLETLRDGQVQVRIDDTTTGGTAPEFFSIDYAEVSVTYSCDGSAAEQCNAMDDNCDGRIDEELTQSPYYADMDGNGRFGTLVGHFCASPGYGATAVNETCAATEKQCGDGDDNDQDGLIDAFDPDCHSDGNAANTQTFSATDDTETAGGGQCQGATQYTLGTAHQITNPDPDNGVIATYGDNTNCDGWPDAVLTGITYKDTASGNDSFAVMTPRCQILNVTGTLGDQLTDPPSTAYNGVSTTGIQSFCQPGMFAVGLYQKDISPGAANPDMLDGIVLACASLINGTLSEPQQASPLPPDLASNTRPFVPVLCPQGDVLTGYFYNGLNAADSIKYLRCRTLSSFCSLNP